MSYSMRSEIKTLKLLQSRLDSLKDEVSRKTSWRPSEKAMSIAGYDEEIEALATAIKLMEANILASGGE